jgi:hypothetical protein
VYLIQDNKLNVDHFKAFIEDKTWIRVPRALGAATSYFYILKYEDEDKIVKLVLKPHKELCITETYKNYTLNGEPAPKNTKAQTCEWGFYLEVVVDDNFIEHVQKVAEEQKKEQKQVLTW